MFGFQDDTQWIDISAPDYDPIKYPYGKGKKMVFVDSEGIIRADEWSEGLRFRIVPTSKKIGESWE